MSDRELLELAAKAVGYKFYRSKFGHWIVTTPEGDRVECCVGFIRYDSYTGADLGLPSVEDALSELGWNPLTDDGDALRLAVKLNLRISIEAERAGGITVEWNSDGDGSALSDVEEYAPIGGDDYAATRRAIVRAAAEIGKAMS